MSTLRYVFVAAATLLSACATSVRDVVPESPDVRTSATDTEAAPDAYAYVARRPHGVVALAEARHLERADAHGMVDRLAESLEGCARRLEAEGNLVEGAARIVAVAGPTGAVEGLHVRLAPGPKVAHNALLCVVAPVRALSFPWREGAGAPAIAIEVTWGAVSAGE